MNTPENSKHFKNKLLFNDERMFEFVFKAYFPRLMAFALKFIPNKAEAEDIIQEVFLKIWLKRTEIEESTFQSYLFTMVRNTCLNHIKHQKIINNHLQEFENSDKREGLYYADFFSDPYHQTIFNEIQNEITTVMNNLPEQTRKVFHLSRFEGLKNAEIAKKLNVSLRTIEKHNSKALQKFKVHFSTHYVIAIAVIDLIKEL